MVPEFQYVRDPQMEGIELDLPEFDLSSIDSLEGTALGQILQDLYSPGRDITADKSLPEGISTFFCSMVTFSSHSSHSSFHSNAGS